MTDEARWGSLATVYGYPRQGRDRALKRAVEAYWGGRVEAADFLNTCREIRLERLAELRDAGLDEIPSNDFSMYDHVLDTIVLFGAEPERYRAALSGSDGERARLDHYFAMSRGTAELAPLEMTKWFNTNYHYLVPEVGPETTFTLNEQKPVGEFVEARAIGVSARPVILGPITFLLLSKAAAGSPDGFQPIQLLESLLPLYVELLEHLHDEGAEWVQLDEPALVLDQPRDVLDKVAFAYDVLTSAEHRPQLLVASYFDRLGEALPVLAESGVEGLGMDFTGRAARNLEGLAAIGGIRDKRLVAGVIDGHNVWTGDLVAALSTLGVLLGLAGRVDVGSSCSLLHVPLDVRDERYLDAAVVPWLCFARQKIDEVVTLAHALDNGRDSVQAAISDNEAALAARRRSPLVRDPAVRQASAAVAEADLHRTSPYSTRRELQHSRLGLPILPTTTIGSFPQTAELRRTRAAFGAGRIDAASYEKAMREEIRKVVRDQEDLGLDVLVHGEAERNDMVQYFAEQLRGFVATEQGWVQSYGSRYVRPPIIVGDVSRPEPMTTRWTTYAQSVTERPMKGMLTGPVTMLAWSFVRDDLPLSEVAMQVALALRDEVLDLEKAGVPIIQVDEPALRETLPLRQEDQAEYLEWASRSFRLTTSGVADCTQIHTHMCYAEFGDVMSTIVELDADVISLEAARSQMAILGELEKIGYPNEVGPGVWDIHSPRVPSVEEIADRLRHAVEGFPADRLWVNPDCGLKTRGSEEVDASLSNLVQATKLVRGQL